MLPDGMVPLYITIKPVTWAGDEGGDAFLELEIADPGGIDDDKLRRDIIAMTGLTDRYILEERRSTFEWGASAEGLNILLTLAQDAWPGIIGGAAWGFVKRTWNATGRAITKPKSAPTDDEIHGEARYRVAAHYDNVDADSLTVLETMTGTTAEGFEWTVLLKSPDGISYSVRRTATNEFSMTKIERSS